MAAGIERIKTTDAHGNRCRSDCGDPCNRNHVAAKTSHDGGKRLLNLLKGHRYHHGRHKFQSRTGDVNTCGRYCAFRFNCESFSYERFRRLLDFKGLHPDDLITLLTISVDFAHINKS